jgi:hypothetical protein
MVPDAPVPIDSKKVIKANKPKKDVATIAASGDSLV